MEEPGTRYRVEMRSGRGDPIHLTSRSGSIRIPLKKWQTLLSANAGEALLWDVSVLDAQGRWSQFDTVTNRIAQEAIDGYLVYRLLKPLYSVYDHLGIYERALSSFAERPVLENRRFGGDCLNCHTFLNRRADTFALNIRTTAKTHPMLLVRSNQVTRVDRTMGYLSWHPSGRLLAFSANKFSLFFHTVGETRDVFDATSNLGLYRVDSNTFDFPPAIALTNRNETWPSWSPDGRHLYYCSAPPAPVERFRQIRYDLMRVSYDPDRDQWGEPELLVAAQQTGLSAAEPRVSPDGRLVLFCLSRYGHFPPYQPSTDLYLLDLQTRRPRRLEINSDQTDSWHCWSSNGRWVVFSSKRLDGLFARPFFSYVDEHGVFHKPFLLPQADPAFYDTYLKNFNAPELVLEPVKVTQDQLTKPLVKP
ncbi:MAG: PD40 domain-containing protein [Verrucomicrobia bacterium]|nr:PD40 domain-containing protein [Verrucomicrobiota bacterium]